VSRSQSDTLAFRHRSAFKLLTAANSKTPKGEKSGYFSAILYLAPHTLGGGATLCPYSTPACREMCLAGAGMSGLPRQLQAKLNRTHLFNTDRDLFMVRLRADLAKLWRIAQVEGLRPAIRLNGTSDVLWERVSPSHGDVNLMKVYPWLQFYDYTKVPLHMRRAAPNYHLTFSIDGPDTIGAGLDYLRAGHSVAVVVPAETKDAWAGYDLQIGGDVFQLIDGDEHDLRFLDPPGSIILLKPKGHVVTSLLRPDFIRELRAAA
jgi:hypothetical protein